VKKVYKIAVTWQAFGEVEMEANSLEEALDKAEADPDKISLPEANYVDESFRVDRNMSKYINMTEKELACYSDYD